jgi:uncharacterized protein (DUF849 family)
MIIQACLNGSRDKAYHAAVPATPEEIVRDAAAAVRAGANELHVHIRGEDGRETLKPDVVDKTIAALRKACPGTAIGISSGHWIEKDDFRRRDYLRGLTVLPDYASVNINEGDATGVCSILQDRGVGIEAGIWIAKDAERCLELGLAAPALRFLIEIMHQDREQALAEITAIDAVLARAPRAKPVLLHGTDETVWALADRAIMRGQSTRVGFEDGKTLPDGSEAASNAAIVAAAVFRRAQLSAG